MVSLSLAKFFTINSNLSISSPVVTSSLLMANAVVGTPSIWIKLGALTCKTPLIMIWAPEVVLVM